MKAIFLCEKNDKIFSVYDADTISELQRMTNIEKKIYSKADVTRDRAAFSDVELVFSTWGMPSFTEEEIKDL